MANTELVSFWPLAGHREAKIGQVSHSGFGGIHGAVLALVAKCLGSGRWIDDVRPQTDAELVDASVYGAGEFKISHDVCRIALT